MLKHFIVLGDLVEETSSMLSLDGSGLEVRTTVSLITVASGHVLQVLLFVSCI